MTLMEQLGLAEEGRPTALGGTALAALLGLGGVGAGLGGLKLIRSLARPKVLGTLEEAAGPALNRGTQLAEGGGPRSILDLLTKTENPAGMPEQGLGYKKWLSEQPAGSWPEPTPLPPSRGPFTHDPILDEILAEQGYVPALRNTPNKFLTPRQGEAADLLAAHKGNLTPDELSEFGDLGAGANEIGLEGLGQEPPVPPQIRNLVDVPTGAFLQIDPVTKLRQLMAKAGEHKFGMRYGPSPEALEAALYSLEKWRAQGNMPVDVADAIRNLLHRGR